MSKKCCRKNFDKKIICIAGPQGPRGVQGKQGDVGPQGPAGVNYLDSILLSFDRKQVVNTNSLVQFNSTINQTGTSITFNSPSTITVQSGTYFILFCALIANDSTAGDVGASIQVDGIIVPSASQYVPASSVQAQMVLQHSITVTVQTTIQVKNISPVANDFHDASISI